MVDAKQASAAAPESRRPKSSSRAWALGIGICFGYLLQKGGVAKFDILVGALLLEEFAVFEVILAAILTGMVGVHWLHARGVVELDIKPTRYAANVAGGLIFGVGFGLSGYCPGTGAAALGQGNLDAAFVILGMLAGSYVFAECSGWIARVVTPIGARGELTLPELVSAHRKPFLIGFGALLLSAMVLLAAS